MMKQFSSLLLFMLFSSGVFAQDDVVQHYLFVGHTYDGYTYDHRLSQINIKNYDGIFLGGDILSEASLD